MNDRLVEYPNRYRLQAVEGESDIYDLIPAPGIVTEEGTPLNKSTIFNDTVSARYGLEHRRQPLAGRCRFSPLPYLHQDGAARWMRMAGIRIRCQ